MRAIVIERFGEPDVLEWREVADPRPGPPDLLIRIHAAGVNRADCLQRLGRYPAPSGAPATIPGLEFAGEVVECGAQVDGWSAGDAVMGILPGGGYAELATVDHRLVFRVPAGLEMASAAAIPEAFVTAWDALVEQSALRPGEIVLVTAAASGVGTAALQLARAAGALAIGASRDAARRARLAEFGAEIAIDPADPTAAAARVLELSGGRGADVVLDLVGAAGWPLYERCVAERGRIIVVGLLGGSRVELDLARLLTRRWRIRGTVLRSRPLAEKIELCRTFRDRALRLFDRGTLTPVVDHRLPIERAADAHRLMQSNAHVGKIVLTVIE